MPRLFPLLLLPLLAVAAPVPKETEAQKLKRLFGELADAKKGYDFKLDGDKLVLTMAAEATESPIGEATSPFIGREVKGDFEARAVLTFTPPKVKLDEAGKTPFVAAGFCVRGESGGMVLAAPYFGGGTGKQNPDGWGVGMFTRYTTPDEKPAVGYNARAKYRGFQDRHVLIWREGDKIKLGISEDGKEWTMSADSLPTDLPDTVRVGVFGMNTSSVECTATFSDFTVVPLKK